MVYFFAIFVLIIFGSILFHAIMGIVSGELGFVSSLLFLFFVVGLLLLVPGGFGLLICAFAYLVGDSRRLDPTGSILWWSVALLVSGLAFAFVSSFAMDHWPNRKRQ